MFRLPGFRPEKGMKSTGSMTWPDQQYLALVKLGSVRASTLAASLGAGPCRTLRRNGDPHPRHRLDTVHGRDLAIIIEPRLIFAAHPDQLGIKIIELGRQMRSGAGRHPAPDFAAINDDDGAAKPAELVGCRESSNTGADHNDVTHFIALQWRRFDCR